MPTLLVVDDNPGDRRLVREVLRERQDLDIVEASSGTQALADVLRASPDIVLTDLRMPDMDGLRLTERLREAGVAAPVVLMTGHGSEEVAVAALRSGATSYVPKNYLMRDLAATLDKVLMVVFPERARSQVLAAVERLEADFVLENDPSMIQPLVSNLCQYLVPMGIVDESGTMQVGVAFAEALQNALFHGNLGLSSEWCDREEGDFLETAEQRRRERPWCGRQIRASVRLSSGEAVLVVRDEGEGFDIAGVPDPRLPENLERCSGRGLFLIRMFMDGVTHNPRGNEITMIKRRVGGSVP